MPNAPHLPQVPPAAPAATFGQIDKSAARSAGHPPPDYAEIAQRPEFHELRSRLRRFVFPMSAAFLIWYLGYVVLAAYLPEFMSIRLIGEINVGLVMGVGQFATTILIIVLYLRYAARHVDPRVRALHLDVTGEDPR
ncbi:Uncharacterized membrane protein, DUF485 family [Saccharopolyspora kobensis]|uniref:Uncharacterized membrane protein, DUF485 family n=1 Tax=Saccharopolyspora kobensis TaxID=146035 RepID=A0A1H6EKF1_9PSEU|nr:DUF485 domain-containing protein [Saccharopolyspora kobensis]SEG98337.1 Uncharacterized membrane protein, DUF485 family [Saccharopolyspora kobensis]SFE70116.1 Uncharacterized membrane protein, DUF485 family [Saccharopolyspora kobensis]